MLVVCLFLYTHCLFSDTFLGFQLVCLLVSFSFSLKLCLIGEEDEHHHLVIEYTFWIQTDHHSFYILFFITSNNAKNMKDYDQILRHTVENVFPAFPISDQGHCDKRKDATPGGFFPIPSFVPSPPPYFVMLWRWCFYHRVLFRTPVSLLLLSLPLLLCAPTDISTLPVNREREMLVPKGRLLIPQ